MVQSQSLFYWIIYSYSNITIDPSGVVPSLNPYFIGLSILINPVSGFTILIEGLNPYFIGLSILIK